MLQRAGEKVFGVMPLAGARLLSAAWRSLNAVASRLLLLLLLPHPIIYS